MLTDQELMATLVYTKHKKAARQSGAIDKSDKAKLTTRYNRRPDILAFDATVVLKQKIDMQLLHNATILLDTDEFDDVFSRYCYLPVKQDTISLWYFETLDKINQMLFEPTPYTGVVVKAFLGLR